jgi:nucleoside-diphosphate kinase
MTYERSLIIIKPDGIQRNLTGEIITRFEKKGLKKIVTSN